VGRRVENRNDAFGTCNVVRDGILTKGWQCLEGDETGSNDNERLTRASFAPSRAASGDKGTYLIYNGIYRVYHTLPIVTILPRSCHKAPTKPAIGALDILEIPERSIYPSFLAKGRRRKPVFGKFRVGRRF
jgi:hypothetical protein